MLDNKNERCETYILSQNLLWSTELCYDPMFLFTILNIEYIFAPNEI